ncbi:hypothetical protein [Streptomyces sp. NPDC086787]
MVLPSAPARAADVDCDTGDTITGNTPTNCLRSPVVVTGCVG